MNGLIRYVLKAPSLAGVSGDLITVYGASMPVNSFRAM
jgi:hypothetical protein